MVMVITFICDTAPSPFENSIPCYQSFESGWVNTLGSFINTWHSECVYGPKGLSAWQVWPHYFLDQYFLFIYFFSPAGPTTWVVTWSMFILPNDRLNVKWRYVCPLFTFDGIYSRGFCHCLTFHLVRFGAGRRVPLLLPPKTVCVLTWSDTRERWPAASVGRCWAQPTSPATWRRTAKPTSTPATKVFCTWQKNMAIAPKNAVEPWFLDCTNVDGKKCAGNIFFKKSMFMCRVLLYILCECTL